jgi:alpha-glucosidase
MAQQAYSVHSPNDRIEVKIHGGDRITYDVLVGGKTLLTGSTFSISIDGATLGPGAQITSTKERSVDQWLEPVVRQKFARIHEHYNELRIDTPAQLAVVFRAYNEGVAYRLETSLPGDQVKVYGEEVRLNFAQDDKLFYPEEEGFMSHNERLYLPRVMSQIGPKTLATLPAVVDAGGVKVAVAESGVEDYPGMWLVGTGSAALASTFPHYPLKEELDGDRNLKVTQAADYIAITKGTRTYPWRVLGIAERDADLITNQLVWLLEKPAEPGDTSWIRPGKVAWDWWNANNVYGVPFKAGVNTETYKYYIDFAAQHNLDYVILDEGWYKLGHVLEVVPEINMPELAAYAREKKVGLILWVVWKSLADQLLPALDQFEKWGVKGVKIDFMQRDDQPMVNWMQMVCREAAKRKLLVDYHGVQRTATMTRTFPNLISNEGVRGNEWSKWSADASPDHTVTLPFTRMFLGPMDYTPGAMLNAQKKSFAAVFDRPMALGTRCNQLAMYVVFESPLQMLSDSPSNYLREPESLWFLSKVPSVWDETVALGGSIGDYVTVARRNGSVWFAGAMTNWTARDLDIDLSFLPSGHHYVITAYQDGVNADRFASDYRQTEAKVDHNTKLKVHLAPGGGWAARIVEEGGEGN